MHFSTPTFLAGLATVVTASNTTFTTTAPVAPLASPGPATPIINGTGISNLSRTITSAATSQSVFITTISGPNGFLSTETSVVVAVATPTHTSIVAPGAPTQSGSGSVQSGVGSHKQVGAGAGLAVAAGIGAFFL